MGAEKFESIKGQMKEGKPDYVEEGEQYAATATISKHARPSGEEYFVMNTLNITPALKSVCSFVYPQSEDKDWALEAWRSIRPPADRKP